MQQPSGIDNYIPSGIINDELIEEPKVDENSIKSDANIYAQLMMYRMMRMKDHKLLKHYSDKGRKKKKIKRQMAKTSRKRNRG